MAIGVGDILRLACQWALNGTDQIVNVHTMRVLDTGTTTDDLDLMLSISSILETELYSFVTGLILDTLVATLIDAVNLTDNTTVPSVSWDADGTRTGEEQMPSQTGGLVFLNGAPLRRQGRCYLPPFSEALGMSGANWGSSALSGLTSFGVALLAPLTDGDVIIERVVCHPDGSSPFIPSSAGVSVAPRTQRRRTPGRGA